MELRGSLLRIANPRKHNEAFVLKIHEHLH